MFIEISRTLLISENVSRQFNYFDSIHNCVAPIQAGRKKIDNKEVKD